jgi:hypothetical protein
MERVEQEKGLKVMKESRMVNKRERSRRGGQEIRERI